MSPSLDPYDHQRMMKASMESQQRSAVQSTARDTNESRRLMKQMVEHAVETANAAEVRERQMLRWTQAGVVLAAIAAVASLVAIIVTVVVA